MITQKTEKIIHDGSKIVFDSTYEEIEKILSNVPDNPSIRMHIIDEILKNSISSIICYRLLTPIKEFSIPDVKVFLGSIIEDIFLKMKVYNDKYGTDPDSSL